MRIKNKKSKIYKKISLIIASFIFIMGIVVFFLWFLDKNSNQNINNSNATQISKKPSVDSADKDSQKTNSTNKNSGQPDSPEEIKKSQSNTDQAPKPIPPTQGETKSTVNISIPSAFLDGNIYKITTLIPHVTNEGECSIVIKDKKGNTFSEKVKVQALPASSTCQGFHIPSEKLVAGRWNIDLNFTNNKTKASLQKEITVK